MAAELEERQGKLDELIAGRAEIDEELQRLRAEVAAAKAANAAKPDTHDYSEAETRDSFIDLLLREAGWDPAAPDAVEYEVSGMPSGSGRGFVDYVLWGDDGKPVGLVEAKRTKVDARRGQQQAKLYADCLEQAFGQRPIIFYSNGYEHWLWDDAHYPPRAVQGFYDKEQLGLLIQRRTTRQPLAEASIDPAIAGRYYQTRAIRRIGESFERDNTRKALLVMATGAGKTRTVIALCDMLMRQNWAKRVLFLADRIALVNQAVNAFKAHLPSSAPVNLVTEKEKEGRVYVSTYPTMMGLIDEVKDGQRRFGVGHFDLVIIDEAHRSVYQKYGAIFDYFDSLLVGLTATPKDEIDRNTYRLFDLQSGVPTDVYSLEEAVADGHLVPPIPISVPLKFQREGISYDELTEEERDQWDALEWDESGEVPERVDAGAINQWLFNEDTVDKVLEHLMRSGIKVAGGDRIGKTIIFAKNHKHAEFIADRFNANYPRYKGSFARVIDYQQSYAQTLLDDFSSAEKEPHIAISVDMLDTGIDIPEVVNLVFFKRVRSKTKFWQMIGRGTRLRPDLFGPGEHKECFYVFDYCDNFAFFNQDTPTREASAPPSLDTRLFLTRLELTSTLDAGTPEEAAGEGGTLREDPAPYDGDDHAALRSEVAELLRRRVEEMNTDNFIVRPKRAHVERYAKAAEWERVTTEKVAEITTHIAPLPSELIDDDIDAKSFDMLMLRLQLSVLRVEPGFARLRDQVRKIAAALEEKANIPMVKAQLVLIADIQTDEYWEDVTAPILEVGRKRLRELVKFVDKTERPTVFTDFEDEMGPETEVSLTGLVAAGDFERFRLKVRNFLRQHMDHMSVQRIRMNQQLTANDLPELERLIIEAGIGSDADIEQVREKTNLGAFFRSLVGLDRSAAMGVFSDLLQQGTHTPNQIEFLNLVIEQLVEHGLMDPARLYESPYTDISPQGPDGLFTSGEVDQLIAGLREVQARATG